MTTLSRRNFLVASSAAGVAALAPSVEAKQRERIKVDDAKNFPSANDSEALFQKKGAPTPDLKLTQTFNLGKSRIDEGEVISAGRWGIFYPQIKGGKIVAVRPFEYDYAPSPNLQGLINLPYSPSRIKYPMVRESYLKKGPESRKNRGTDRFVRVSWDTAIKLVAKEINRVYDNYGPSAVWGSSYGWMSTGKVNASINLMKRVLNLRGGFIGTSNNYSQAAIMTILPYVLGEQDPRSQTWDMLLEHSERIVFWGCDPLVTNDVDWYTTLHNNYGYIRALKEKGIKTIAINPLKPDTADYLNSEWIAPRPGTDCAMMLGMIYELEDKGLADHKFLDKYTSGYPEFLAYVQGKTDNVPKTPAWAAKICGVPAEKIISLAHEFKENRTMLMVGWGIQRIQYGEQPHWMAVTLSAVLGQIGMPGAGYGENYHYSNGGAPMATGPYLSGIAAGVKPIKESTKPWVGSKVIPVMRFVDCFLNPGQKFEHNGNTLTYPHVRLVFWSGGNPFTHQPDTMRLEKAWRKPETIIVTDTAWTATARHADIVLPAATTLEHNDITNIGEFSNDGFVAMKQAIEPQWESKADYEIYSMLSKELGFEKEFTEGLDEMGWIKRLYNESLKQAKIMKVRMPSFEEFWEKGYKMFEVKDKDREYVSFANFREDPELYSLATESGKIQIFSPKIASFKYDDCRGYPSYFEPIEGVNRRTADYPLALMACKSRYRLHSQLDGTSMHDLANVEGREPCWMNPADAKKRGLSNGDVVVVKSRRGKLMAGLYVTERVMPGVIVVHHGAWYDPQTVKGYGYMDVRGQSNTLTMDISTSKLACGNIASTANVQVEKFKGDLPDIAVYQQPKRAIRDVK